MPSTNPKSPISSLPTKSPNPQFPDFLDSFLQHRNELVSLLSRYVSQGKGILQPHHLIDELEAVLGEKGCEKLADGPFCDVLKNTQEAIVLAPFVAVRPRPGVWEFVRVNISELSVDELTASEYLKFKDDLVDGQSTDQYMLELDFEPFNSRVPRASRSSSIGNGVQLLNRHLSSIMFRNKDCLEPLLEFLRKHKHRGQIMMLNDRVQSIRRLEASLAKAEDYLTKVPPETPYSKFEYKFQELGFERGWGDTAYRFQELGECFLFDFVCLDLFFSSSIDLSLDVLL
ncbi:sucrose synthase [Ranunculus cassubicifolius]